MKQDWEVKKLGEVCEFLNRGISPKYIDLGGVCVLNQKCIRSHVVSFDQSRRHDSSIKPVSSERFIKSGDVLVNSTGTGTLGRVAQIRNIPLEPTTVDSHVTIVRPKKGMFFSDFFGYMLIFIEDLIKNSGDGCGGQTELARLVLAKKFLVFYPKSIPEQQRIVKILDEVFAGIAKAIENAEKNLAKAREIFTSYLNNVFESPGEDWEEKTLKDIAIEFGRGRSKNRPRNDKKLYGGKYPFIQTGDVRNSKHFIKEYSQTYNEVGLAQSKLWPKGTICITIAANIAETGILGFDGCFPDSLIGLIVNPKKANEEFIEYLLSFYKTKIQMKSKGSAQANINMGTFENEKFAIPPLPIQQSIVTKLDQLNLQTKKLETIYQQKLADLEELKKSVLQKAFNGELTMGEA